MKQTIVFARVAIESYKPRAWSGGLFITYRTGINPSSSSQVQQARLSYRSRYEKKTSLFRLHHPTTPVFPAVA